MRTFFLSAVALICVTVWCGCSSAPGLQCLAGDPGCGKVFHDYELAVDPAWQPQAPIPVGSSATIHFIERFCVISGSHTGVAPPGVHTGCNAVTPSVLSAVVAPIFGSGKPCPVTAVVTARDAVTVTRNGPGDPGISGGNPPTSGWCRVTVTDRAAIGDSGRPSATFDV
jgi:hypothetical protein